MKRLILAALIVVLFPCLLLAQGPKLQAKVVVRPTIAIDQHWYVASWSITNLRQSAPDNTNIMLGLGRKQPKWWVEAMLHRQYSLKTSQWFVDTRLQIQTGPESRLFVEHAPFLGKKGLFQFVLWEVRRGPYNLGFESENVWRPGHNSLGAGPRAGRKVAKIGKGELNASVASQYRYHEPGFVRVYLVLPIVVR